MREARPSVIALQTLSPAGRGQGEGGDSSDARARDPISNARRLRKNQTDAERLLWGKLRARRLAGFKFRRQEPVARYIVDFCCRDARLVVELDGGHHNRDDVAAIDRRRQQEIERLGFLVKRFWNAEVTSDIDGVCETILALCEGGRAHV
jgi:very-short-patch-repair endonuclease